MTCCEQCRVNEATYIDPDTKLWCRRCYERLPGIQGHDFVHITILIQSMWGLPEAVTRELRPAEWVRASPHLIPIVERVIQLYPERCPPGGRPS